MSSSLGKRWWLGLGGYLLRWSDTDAYGQVVLSISFSSLIHSEDRGTLHFYFQNPFNDLFANNKNPLFFSQTLTLFSVTHFFLPPSILQTCTNSLNWYTMLAHSKIFLKSFEKYVAIRTPGVLPKATNIPIYAHSVIFGRIQHGHKYLLGHVLNFVSLSHQPSLNHFRISYCLITKE